MKTIYNLQVCRAIAAILVLLEHASVIIDPQVLGGFLTVGWCGVDLFFVLSGFIIYYVNHKYIGVSAKYGKYMGKRLLRIYPIYWIYTFAVIIMYGFLFHEYYSAGSITHSLSLYPFHTELQQYPIIAPAHTLTYEIIFYIIFGTGILTGKKGFSGLMLLWLSAILLHALFGLFETNIIVFNFLLNPINIEFFFGCILAWLIINKPFAVTKTQARMLLAAGLLLLLTSWITQLNNYGILLSYQYIKFGIPFSIIIYAVSLLETGSNHNFIKRIFVKLGDASYSIYLIHYVGIHLLVNVVFPRIPLLTNITKLFFCLALLTVVSYYAYKFIEHPVIKYFNRKLK